MGLVSLDELRHGHACHHVPLDGRHQLSDFLEQDLRLLIYHCHHLVYNYTEDIVIASLE